MWILPLVVCYEVLASSFAPALQRSKHNHTSVQVEKKGLPSRPPKYSVSLDLSEKQRDEADVTDAAVTAISDATWLGGVCMKLPHGLSVTGFGGSVWLAVSDCFSFSTLH